MDQAVVGIDFEAGGLQRLQSFRVPLEDGASLGEQRVREKIEAALGGDVGLQHSYRAGRGIARVGELRQTLLFALVVHALKGGQRHQQFAAHFEVGRQAGLGQRLGGNGERHTAHGAHVEGHVFAHRAVAAGDAQRQLAAGKAQGQRHAVELQLADVVHARLAAQLVDAPLPIAQLLLAVSVVQRHHGRGMRNFDEALARLAAHALGGRVGGDQLGMLGLERLQLVHQAIEFGVADLGIVEHVVAVLVVADFLAQRVDLLLHIFAGWHEAIMPVASSQ